MKVTIQFDDATELSPRELRAMQDLAERRRQYNSQLAQRELEGTHVVRSLGFGQTLGELFERKGVVR